MTDSLNEMARIIPPSPWVAGHLGYFAPGARVLDLACGSGRHSRLLASLGHPVLAVERDAEALAGLYGLPGIETLQADLEGDEWPLAGHQFAGIVVTNYLWRPRFADLLALLAPGGVLVYETFMLGNEAYGKPSSPKFLLQPGELRERVAAAGWREIAFDEGYTATPKPAMRQAVCAQRP